HHYTGRTIVAPQTVVVEQYWDEIMSGLASAGVEVRAFTLDSTPAEHERRIAGDTLPIATIDQTAAHHGGVGWRPPRARAHRAALSWLAARTEVLDTTTLRPEQVAKEVATRAGLLT